MTDTQLHTLIAAIIFSGNPGMGVEVAALTASNLRDKVDEIRKHLESTKGGK